MLKLRKVIYALLIGSFAAWVGVYVWLHVSYSSHLPPQPEEQDGRVYRMVVNHGFVVYGSEREFRILRTVENMQPFAILCLVVAVITGLKFGDFKIAPGRKLNE